MNSVDWKKEIENLRSRIDRCEQTAIKLKSSLASLIKEIRTCEYAKQLNIGNETSGKNNSLTADLRLRSESRS